MKPLSASFQNFTQKITGWGRVERGTLKVDPELAPLSVAEIMERSGLGFNPLKVAIGYNNPLTGQFSEYDDKFIIIRSDTGEAIGTVGRRYNPIPYYAAIESAFGDIVTAGGIPTRAVSMDNGAKMAVQFALPEGWLVADCEHGLFVNLFSSHNGTLAIVVNSADIRIVCGNTFAMALASQTDRHSVKHTASAYDRLTAVQKALFGIRESAQYYYGALDTFAAHKASSAEVQQFLSAVIPDKEKGESKRDNSQPANRREAVYLAAGQSAEERNTADITFYDLLQGVTRVSSYKTTEKRTDNFEYVTFGPGGDLNNKAYAILEEMAGTK